MFKGLDNPDEDSKPETNLDNIRNILESAEKHFADLDKDAIQDPEDVIQTDGSGV